MSDGIRVWIRKRKGKKKTTYHLRWISDTGKWRNKRVGTDVKLAQREAAKLEMQLAEGTYLDVQRVSWSEFVADHVGKIPGRRHAVNVRIILDEFGELLQPAGPHAVTFGMLESYAVKLREKGNATTTINGKIKFVRSAIKNAVLRGNAAKIPDTAGLRQPEEQRPPRIVTEAEEGELLEAAESLFGFPMRAMAYTALNTGGRRGELFGLPWERIRLEGSKPQIHFTKTKSRRDRYVPINSDVVDILRQMRMQTAFLAGPFANLKPSFHRKWTRIVEKAGVEHVTFHDLRSAFVTRLILAGVALPTVQRLAGHADIKTTIKFYTWISDDELRAGVSKLKRGVG